MASLLRTGATRSLLRTSFQPRPTTAPFRTQLHTLSSRPEVLSAPKTLALTKRWQSGGAREPVDSVNTKREERLMDKKIRPTPDSVSTSSTILPSVGIENPRSGSAAPEAEQDPQMMKGINADLQTIRETFSLEEVPRQAYYMGMAGVVPYAATSAATVFCAYEINTAAATGTGMVFSEKTAELLLHIIEPLQIGYGAVIISFLGAIHWGLEWAKFGGEIGYPRYFIGVFATAAAWPTILLPAEYALIAQFLVFNFLYYTDSRASKRGWAPPWYGVYRFVLTFIVGASIVFSLIGRGQIADQIGRLPGPADRIRELQEWRAAQEETEEEARRRMLADKEEEDE